MVEFAFVVVLLIALLYGIVTYGLILGAQSTVTQAAADGARAGLVTPATATTTASGQAASDLGWMNKGVCGTSPSSTTVLTCVATQGACASNATTGANNQCLTVTVTYKYSQSPLFPELPGMGVIVPSTLSSTNVVQISEPSS
jgi:Flp pilus assembly protein TadG